MINLTETSEVTPYPRVADQRPSEGARAFARSRETSRSAISVRGGRDPRCLEHPPGIASTMRIISVERPKFDRYSNDTDVTVVRHGRHSRDVTGVTVVTSRHW